MRLLIVGFVAAGVGAVATASTSDAASGCVWRVTDGKGGQLYLGGSFHALRDQDYPLPSGFNRAFDASSRLMFEVDLKSYAGAQGSLEKKGTYPKGDSLKNHVDPRTYEYLRRFFALIHVPEAQFAKYRPWMIVLALESPSSHASNLGVEGFLARRASANHKPMSGLESNAEHDAIFSGLNDRQSEAVLLMTFIPRTPGTDEFEKSISAWRRGDADTLTRVMRAGYSDYPAFADRLLSDRNRNWIPKIEKALHSGQTYFVVAGAAHMGGPDGVLALLRARGYQIEQL
jgi:uncharacterized protein YbaP (TraB family)